MDLANYYPHLEGSHGKVRLQLGQGFLGQLCALLKTQASGHLDDIRIEPSGQNRFRIRAELSNRYYHGVGSLALRVLREQGIEIQIERHTASPKDPSLHGWMDTTVIGRSLAIPKLVQAINEASGRRHGYQGERIRMAGVGAIPCVRQPGSFPAAAEIPARGARRSCHPGAVLRRKMRFSWKWLGSIPVQLSLTYEPRRTNMDEQLQGLLTNLLVCMQRIKVA